MSHAALSTSGSALKAFKEDETGQTMVEYVMLIVLVALAVFMLSPNVRDGILGVFQHTSSVLQ